MQGYLLRTVFLESVVILEISYVWFLKYQCFVYRYKALVCTFYVYILEFLQAMWQQLSVYFIIFSYCMFMLSSCIFQSSIWTLTSVVTMTLNPDDLSDLEVLDENTIVQALRSRYNKEKFYVSFYSVYIKMPACYKCRISIKILIINFVWLKPVIVKRIH